MDRCHLPLRMLSMFLNICMSLYFHNDHILFLTCVFNQVDFPPIIKLGTCITFGYSLQDSFIIKTLKPILEFGQKL